MQNDLKKNKEESFHSITLLHAGLTILGDELFKESNNAENLNRFIEYKYYGNEMREMYKEEFDDDDGNSNVVQLGQKKFEFYNTKVNSPKKIKNVKNSMTFYELVNQTMAKGNSFESKTIKDLSASIECDQSQYLGEQKAPDLFNSDNLGRLETTRQSEKPSENGEQNENGHLK